MRRFLIITVIALMVLGCNKKDDEETSELPQINVTDFQEEDAIQDSEAAPEAKTADTVKESMSDPVFKDYEYPASTLESTIVMGDTVSNIYKSSNDFAKVVEFYKQKYPDAPDQSGTTAYFGKTNEDGSEFTVTLTKLDNETQIILRQDKKM